MTLEEKAIAKDSVPMVPYLRLPETSDEQACLMGSRCPVCQETFLGERVLCVKCGNQEGIEAVKLSRTGELFTFTIVCHSAPWVQVPYVAAIVKLPEGPLVKATIIDIEPDPEKLENGMKLEMVVRKVRKDDADRDVWAYMFRPAGN